MSLSREGMAEFQREVFELCEIVESRHGADCWREIFCVFLEGQMKAGTDAEVILEMLRGISSAGALRLESEGARS